MISPNREHFIGTHLKHEKKSEVSTNAKRNLIKSNIMGCMFYCDECYILNKTVLVKMKKMFTNKIINQCDKLHETLIIYLLVQPNRANITEYELKKIE